MGTKTDTYVDRALRWAMEALDSTEYQTLCLKFVEDAYEISNDVELDGYSTAKESAEAYDAQENIGLPPRGAYAFYDCWGTIEGKRRNWGHVGLSMGDGRVIHAWDRVRVDQYLDIQDLDAGPGWTRPEYIGWAPVSLVLEGMVAHSPTRGGAEG